MLESSPTTVGLEGGPDASVLDAASLAQLRALDPSGGSAFILRVLDTYLRSLDRQVALVHEALAQGDHDGLSRAMHTLKSASASVGALHLAGLCESIEHRLRLGETDGLAQRVQGFLAEAGRVSQAVAAYRGSASA
jgi:HPt (histidine-containing phosphotransfer) domain-containing protein